MPVGSNRGGDNIVVIKEEPASAIPVSPCTCTLNIDEQSNLTLFALTTLE